MNELHYWWKLQLANAEIAESSYVLFELGAKGVELISESAALCYFECSERELQKICSQIESSNFSVLSSVRVEQEDWNASSRAHWGKVVADKLTIVSVEEASQAGVFSDPNQIYIIPGMGFGTGHHDTTKMVLELLQTPEGAQPSGAKLLDLGTGSGVLAIALAKVQVNPVLAVDNDPEALENAKRNIEINGCGESVTVKLGTLAQVSEYGPFDLIVANITADVLADISDLLYQTLTPTGKLILSGVRIEQQELIDRGFPPGRWKVMLSRDTESWHARLLAVIKQ